MLFLEVFGPGAALQVVATDVNAAALARAQHASYGPWSFRNVEEVRKKAWFEPDTREGAPVDGLRPIEAVRSRVHFRPLNLAADGRARQSLAARLRSGRLPQRARLLRTGGGAAGSATLRRISRTAGRAGLGVDRSSAGVDRAPSRAARAAGVRAGGAGGPAERARTDGSRAQPDDAGAALAHLAGAAFAHPRVTAF